MKDRSSKVKKRYRSFNPDIVANQLFQAISRDFPLMGKIDETQLYSSNLSAQYIFDWRMNYEFLKKFKTSQSDQETLTQEAYRSFNGTNAHLKYVRAHALSLPTPGVFCSRKSEFGLRQLIWLRARNLFQEVLGELSLNSWFDACRHSSGTTLGLKFSKTNVEDKWRYPITVTAGALPFIQLYLKWDTQMADAIRELNIGNENPMWSVVEGSRATTVDKDDRNRRFICVEPTANMFLQQGLRRIMERCLRRFGLDISVLQDQHKMLANLYSLTLKGATVDFSKASDCVLIEVVKFLSDTSWFTALSAIRSPKTLINDQFEELAMISSMGNATTFPLETLIFFVIGIATVSLDRDTSCSQFVTVCDNLPEAFGVSVFGDDCIIPSKSVDRFINTLTDVGFSINVKKTFTGNVPFRESCGGDYYCYRDVRPLQLKNPTGTRVSDLEPWLYTVWNLAQKKYISYFGDLTYCYQLLFDVIARILSRYEISVKIVPSYYPDDSGIHLSDPRLLRVLRERKNKFSKVIQDKHGTAKFNFVRFRYPDDGDVSYQLRYAIKLKGLAALYQDDEYERKVLEKYKIKQKGGYVVASGVCPYTAEIPQDLVIIKNH